MDYQRNLELHNILGGKEPVPPKSSKNVMPGYRSGLDPETVQQYIKRQKRMRGFRFDLAVGDNNNLDIELSGLARILLGFNLNINQIVTSPFWNGTLDLVVNNETIIDGMPLRCLHPDFIQGAEYYFIPRPLSGQDDIKFNIRGIVDAGEREFGFFYI